MANGKGSKPRKVNGPKYRDNFDNIKWGKKPETEEVAREGIRPTFINCHRCEGVGFILFESMGFVGFEEPIGLIRAKCEICGGDGEIIYRNPETKKSK